MCVSTYVCVSQRNYWLKVVTFQCKSFLDTATDEDEPSTFGLSSLSSVQQPSLSPFMVTPAELGNITDVIIDGANGDNLALMETSSSDESTNSGEFTRGTGRGRRSCRTRGGVRTRGIRTRGLRTRGGRRRPQLSSALSTPDKDRVRVRAGSTNQNWNTIGRQAKRSFPFSRTPGVKIQPDDPTSAVSVFKLLFTDELVKLISDSTNSYADILMENPATQEHMDNHQRSLFNSWKPTHVDEMWIYFAVTLLMGITKKPEYHLYWSKQHLFSTPIFHRLMRRDRFEHIRKMIHFCDPYNEDPSDGLRKLRTTMDYLMYKFMNTYTPERNIAIDEYLSLWKGRLSFRVYIPNKRERYGIKLYMLCESQTGYLLKFIIYTGATTTYPDAPPDLLTSFDDHKSPSKVVLSLLTGYVNAGYCVTLDNYYTSPELAKELVNLGTDCYGTLRKKQGLPVDFWLWKLIKGEQPIKQFDDDIMVLRWNDVTKTKSVKIVSMLSTVHPGNLVDSGKVNRLSGEKIMKPDVIVDYNKTMGGVDLLSRVIIPYSVQRKGVKWYRKIAELFVDAAVYNSYVIYKKLNPDEHHIDHLSYRMKLIEELVMFHLSGSAPHQTGRNIAGPDQNLLRLVERHFISQLPSTAGKQRAQRRCVRCHKLGVRRDTRFWCNVCQVSLCLAECFEIYHTQRDITRKMIDITLDNSIDE